MRMMTSKKSSISTNVSFCHRTVVYWISHRRTLYFTILALLSSSTFKNHLCVHFWFWIHDDWSEWIRPVWEHHHMIWSWISFEFQLICHMSPRKIVTRKKIKWLMIRHNTYLSINFYLQNVQREISTLFLILLWEISDIFLSITSFSSLYACSLISHDPKKFSY